MLPALSAVLVGLIIILFSSIRIAKEFERGVVFRLGRFHGIRGPGLYFLIPLGIERSDIIDMRIKTVSAEQQESITRDSVTIKVNAVLWYKVVDAAKSVIAVRDSSAAVYQLALTSLRNIIGQHDLDEVLQNRDKINELLRAGISPSTTAWGVEIDRFEMKDVLPYIAAQVLGAIAGAGILYLIASGKPGFEVGGFAANGYGDHSPGGYSMVAALVTELVLTFMFLFIILGTTHSKAAPGFAGIAIGLGLTLIHLVSIPVTNTSVNPARSTSQAIFAGDWALGQLWLFWVAPIAGAILAGFVYKMISPEKE
jgi:glycerol uptake facilitator-like aquaporin